MDDLPAPYSVRPARPDEAGAIAALFGECDRALGLEPILLANDLLDDWRRPGVDLRRDTWLVESPRGELVAYAGIWSEGTTLVATAAVHPQHRRRGLGAYLIDRIEEGAELQPAWDGPHVTLMNIILPADDAARALVTSRMYAKARTFQHMEVRLADLPDVDAQRAVEMLPFDPEHDREAMHALIEEAFERHWDYSPTPFDQWWREMTGGTDYDPSLWWWGVVDGRRAGALLGTVRNGQGWVMDLGVLDEWRSRGIGTALLMHAFGEFRRRGFETVGLNVDSENETGATRLYTRAGMRVKTAFDFYAKEMVRAPGSRRIQAPATPQETTDGP
jgi:mycothiol synthase